MNKFAGKTAFVTGPSSDTVTQAGIRAVVTKGKAMIGEAATK
jgi:hypothetical protein